MFGGKFQWIAPFYSIFLVFNRNVSFIKKKKKKGWMCNAVYVYIINWTRKMLDAVKLMFFKIFVTDHLLHDCTFVQYIFTVLEYSSCNRTNFVGNEQIIKIMDQEATFAEAEGIPLIINIFRNDILEVSPLKRIWKMFIFCYN